MFEKIRFTTFQDGEADKIERQSSINGGGEEMNKKEREKFKKLLIREKEKLLGELKHIVENTQKSQREASGDISSYTYHMADIATDSYDREFSLDIASNERKILHQIDEALKQIEDGSYGVCVGCGNNIAKSRLKVIPHTNFCINCQESQESRKI